MFPRSTAVLILFLSLLLGQTHVSAPDSTTAGERSAPQKKCYAVLFALGPRLTLESGPQNLSGMRAHVQFIKSMFAAGVVPLARPLFEDEEMTRVSRVLYFVYVDSAEDAHAVARKEPFVQEGVVEIESISLFLAGVGTLERSAAGR